MNSELTRFPSPIFVGGLQRSGTTLLARLIASHSDVTGLVNTPTDEDEGQFVQDVYMDDHVMGAKRGVRGGASMRWAYHPEAHLVEEDARLRNGAAERLKTSWHPYLEKNDAPYLVEKSPSNLMRVRFLHELFPDAKFIVITRNPIVQALAVRKWGTWKMRAGLDLDLVVDHWLTAMECFRRDMPLVKDVFVCSYESLISDPTSVLASVQKFVGVRPHAINPDGISDQNERYGAYWERMRAERDGRFVSLNSEPGIRNMVFRHIERGVIPVIGKRVVQDIERKYGERIGSFGYSLADIRSVGPWT